MIAKSNNVYVKLALVAFVLVGLALYLFKFEPMLTWKMSTIIVLSLLMLVVPIYRGIRDARDKQKNIPLEDEMSRLLEIYAGAYAFRYSMMAWFLIFIFRGKFPDQEEMLGVGIMASAAIFGLSWVYFRFKGIPNADQD